MHVFVLSLPDSRQRRLSAIAKLQGSGIPFEIVDGVEAQKMWPDTLSVVEQSRGWMKPGEIGCYFGHLRILQRLVDYQLPYACILEDDFCFEPQPDFGLLEIECYLPPYFNYIHLMRNLFINTAYRVIEINGLFNRVCETPYSTVGYIVDSILAKRILDQHTECRMPIDHLYAELSHTGLFYETQKPLIGHQSGLQSDIHHIA